MIKRFEGLSMENKNKLIETIELLNNDYNNVKSCEAKVIIKKRIDELTSQLSKYRKPVFIFEDLGEDELYKYYFVDFTDDELMNLDDVIKVIEEDIWKAKAIGTHFSNEIIL